MGHHDDATSDALKTLFPDRGQIEERQFSRLHKAVLRLDPYRLEAVLSHALLDIDALDSIGRTALVWAVCRGDAVATKLLLEAGANPNLADRFNNPPLYHSTTFACTEMLLSAGADITVTNKWGNSLLFFAYRCDPCTKYVEFLIKAGIPVNARSSTGATPMHFAAEYGCTSMLKLLLQNGADINALDNNGQSVLNYAQCETCDTAEAIEFLLGSGIDYTIPNKLGWTILHYAARFGGFRLLKILRDVKLKNLDTRAFNKDGQTPLQLAQHRTMLPDGFLEELQVLFSEIRARNEQAKITITRASVTHPAENHEPGEIFVDALESQA